MTQLGTLSTQLPRTRLHEIFLTVAGITFGCSIIIINKTVTIINKQASLSIVDKLAFLANTPVRLGKFGTVRYIYLL